MRYLATALLLMFACCAVTKAADSKAAERLQKSAEVINEVMKTPEQGIPSDLLKKAVCVAVVPSYKKVALGIGGSGELGTQFGVLDLVTSLSRTKEHLLFLRTK